MVFAYSKGSVKEDEFKINKKCREKLTTSVVANLVEN
jgi:hypothetical protein